MSCAVTGLTTMTGLFINSIHFDIEKKNLYRVFTKSWVTHGRFYGGLWETLPSAARDHIYCNGEKMLSLDFSAMHPRICYHLLGKPCDFDPYIIDGYSSPYRDHFKRVCLIAINAEDRRKAIGSIEDKLKKDGIDNLNYSQCKELLTAFERQYSEIKQFICSGFALKGIFYDSEIIEHCMKELLIKQNIPVLPIHDELLCPESKEEIVREQMNISYKKIMRDALVKKGIIKSTDLLPEYIVPVIG